MSKRWMVALLAFCLAVSGLSGRSLTAQAAVPGQTTGEQSQAAAILESLGIIAEGELEPESAAPRGSFLTWVMRLCGYEALTEQTPELALPYQDVSQDTALLPYLKVAYGMGFISANDRFEPDAPVTWGEAAKLLMTALGYHVVAEQSGGYPRGYLTFARQCGLFGSGVSPEEAIDGKAAAQLLLDTLEVDMMKPTYGGETVTYTAAPGCTLLKEQHHAARTNGIVDATEITGLLEPESGLRAGTISLGDQIYRCGVQADSLLGLWCTLYYREEDGTREVVYIGADDAYNRVLELDKEEIVKAGAAEYRYFENGAQRTAKLDQTATFLYNGKMRSVSAGAFLPETVGRVSLIDNDRDGSYDVAKVEDYKTYLVAGVSEATHTVSAKSGETLELDPEDGEWRVELYKGGQRTGFDSIRPGQVILAAASVGPGKNQKTLLLSDQRITGSITAIDEDRVSVDGISYSARPWVVSSVRLGRTATVYIDAFGEAAEAELDATIVYGYLNAMERGIFDTYQCRIFTENGRWVSLFLSDRIRFNGESAKRAAVVAELLKDTATGDGCRQLVTYRVNENAEIVELNTAEFYPRFTAEERSAIDQGRFRSFSEQAVSAVYRVNSMSFNSAVAISDQTILFAVPDQKNGADEEGFEIMSVSALEADSNYVFYAYDTDRTGIAAVCQLIAPPTGSINTATSIQNMFIVDELVTTLDPDGVPCPGISGYRMGAEMELVLKDHDVLSEFSEEPIAKGDLIQFAADKRGYVTAVSRVYRSAAGKEQAFLQGGLWGTSAFAAGEIMSVNQAEKRVCIRYGPDSFGTFRLDSGLSGILVYDTVTGRAYPGGPGDLIEGGYLLMSIRYQCAREIILIR